MISLKEKFKCFIGTTFFSKKGISWIISSKITYQFCNLLFKNINYINIYTTILAFILVLTNLIILGLIVFQKINVDINYGNTK